MTPSIRTFLLINLLLSVTLITSLAIIGNLFLAHEDIQTQLDRQLQQTSLRMHAFLSDYTPGQDLSIIQKNLQTIDVSPDTRQIEAQHNSLEIQVWNKNGHLLLHTSGAPNIPMSNGRDGLTTLWLDGYSWRVSTFFDPLTSLTIMVSERSNYRQQLENQLTQDSIFVMLITYPFLGFLIWVIVGRGLGTLRRVAREVRHRAPTNLKPVDIESVPSEIEPLIAELNQLFSRLQEAFNREKRFAADAAHELKTPLAALNTQTQVALRADTPDARNQALLKVLAGVNRSTHVVQQLLTLSRMVPDATINELSDVNVSRQVADITAMLAPEAITKNIELELIKPDTPTIIEANATSIGILIRNILDNAIRYTPENGNVRLVIEENVHEVSLRVIDNGPGIPEPLRERVFERFYRVIGNQTTGSGLGLGIVLQIVKLHHAQIHLRTPDTGQGLEVNIIFKKKISQK